MLAQAAAALHAAHTAGVLHRDIKPGNLLLAGDGRIKVTDFGIAQSSRSGHLTRTGALIGTTGYLAPERVSGRSATVASDLYALGIVGYECLTGQPPFQGEPLQVALAHRDQDLPGLPPGCLSQPGGSALAALIADLTARDPAARPASAAVVAVRAGRIRAASGCRDSRADTLDSRAGAPGGLPRAHRSRARPPAPTSTEPGLTPPAGPRRRRLAPAGLAAGLLGAGLLGWLLATAQAGPAHAHPAQARSGPASASPLASPHRRATPARPAPGPGREPRRGPARARQRRPRSRLYGSRPYGYRAYGYRTGGRRHEGRPGPGQARQGRTPRSRLTPGLWTSAGACAMMWSSGHRL